MKVLKKLFAAALLLTLVAAVTGFVYYYCVTADTALDTKKLTGAVNFIEIYDKNDAPVAETGSIGESKKVRISELPKTAKSAFVAAEDKKFYKHHGLDYARILKATIKNISARSFKQGASTISQQLIKNTHLTNEKTLKRKLKEIKLLVNKYNRKFIHLADSDFLLNRVYLKEFLEKLEKANINCCFSINATPNTLSDERNFELIERFVKDGLVEILIGVEHFSPKVLKILNKNYNMEKLFKALKVMKNEIKLPVMSLYTLVGLPGEDYEAINENIEVFEKINKEKLYDFSFPKFFIPYPDTEIYLHPEKFNVKILTKDWSEYHRWSLPRPIEIIGMKDEDYLNEIEKIAEISGY